MHVGLGFKRLGRHVLACLSLRLAFHSEMLVIAAVATLLLLPALCLLPFWCGGLCAAHPPPPEGQAERAKYKVKVFKKHS